MELATIGTKDVLERIDELLETRYSSAGLGNINDPLAETVYILLSKQTRETVYRRVFRDLRQHYSLWLDARHAHPRDLERILKPSGFQEQRAHQLKALLLAVHESNLERGVGPAAKTPGDLTLGFLSEMSDTDAENFLLTLPGIGPKSARCVLSYSLGRNAFAVDTHVHRIFTRLGLLPSSSRKTDHDPFQAAVPETMRRRLHINLVHHGRAVCRTNNERCSDCVLISFCERGRTAVSLKDGSPVAVDLFAGAGGLSYGFRQAGFRVALAVESCRHSAQTYRFNNPGVPVIEALINDHTRAASLRRFMPGYPRIDALIAGPPCQGYSVNGSRRPDARENYLYRHVACLARQLKVELVVLENVPGVRRVNGRNFLGKIISTLEEAGFSVAAHLLCAGNYGVPQRRLRYFFLGRRGKQKPSPVTPSPTHRRHGEPARSGLPETPSVSGVLALLPTLEAGTEAERLIDANGHEFFNLSTMHHSERVVDRIRSFRRGSEPVSYRRLDPSEAQTIIAGHRALPVHPKLDRTISVREAATVQGFPLDYVFFGPRSKQPLQVANAVPPPLAKAVAQHIRSYLPTVDPEHEPH